MASLKMEGGGRLSITNDVFAMFPNLIKIEKVHIDNPSGNRFQ